MTVPPFPYSRGYDEIGKGMPICFREEITDCERDAIHYGEVTICDGQMVTAGMIGYIAVVTGVGDTVDAARESAYRIVKNRNPERAISERHRRQADARRSRHSHETGMAY